MITSFTRNSLSALIALLLGIETAAAGTISGTVKAQGKTGAEADLNCVKYNSRKFNFLERVNNERMRDFVVYIEGPANWVVVPPEKPIQVVTQRVLQKGAIFSPHVLPLVVGTTVEWPNNDDILHNVFSVSESNPFDLGLYKSPKVEHWTFKKPGRVDVFCSIHTRMSCILLVLENPCYATANEKGAYSIAKVPAGTYRLKAWHERLPSQVKPITVPEQGEVRADFTLGITSLPK